MARGGRDVPALAWAPRSLLIALATTVRPQPMVVTRARIAGTLVRRVLSVRRLGSLEGAEERDEVLLLRLGQLDAEDQVEELHGVLQGQEPSVMQVGR